MTDNSYLKSGKNSDLFQVSIRVCAAFLSRRAFRNCHEGLEGMLLDRVGNESAIVDFFSSIFVRMTI